MGVIIRLPPRPFFLALVALIFFIWTLYKFESNEYEKSKSGTKYINEIESNFEECLNPTRKLIFLIGCNYLTEDIRTELALLLLICIAQKSANSYVVCDRARDCLPNKRCLFECGVRCAGETFKNTETNLFLSLHEWTPSICKSHLNNLTHGQNVEILMKEVDEDLFNSIVFKPKGSGGSQSQWPSFSYLTGSSVDKNFYPELLSLRKAYYGYFLHSSSSYYSFWSSYTRFLYEDNELGKQLFIVTFITIVFVWGFGI